MPEGLSRRNFLKLAATAGAAAAVPGCEPAARKLIPYVIPDENVIPGVATYYATTCSECSAGCGAVAKVMDGRTIKLEGNPADPIGEGSLCARGQAALEGLYNPDRLAHPMIRQSDGRLKKVSWEQAFKTLNDELKKAAASGQDRVAYLGSPAGPSLSQIVGSWLATYKSSPNRAIFYEAINYASMHQAVKACFGRGDLPLYRIDQAEVLISFGANYLETWRSPVELSRQFAAMREIKTRQGKPSIGRTVYVGPRMGITAARSDLWVPAQPGTETALAMGVLNVLVAQRWISPNAGAELDELKAFVAGFEPDKVSKATGVPAATVTRMGEWFGQAQGALAIADSDDPAAHIATFVLNAVTGNVGRTIFFPEGESARQSSAPEEIAALVEAMLDKRIDALVVGGDCNPAFSVAPKARFADALRAVLLVVWMGTVPDETADMARLLIPSHHPLEEWRDTAPRSGAWGLGQPVMQPVVGSRPLADILLDSAHAGGADPKTVPWQDTPAAVKANWLKLRPQVAPSLTDDAFWEKVRRDGGFFAEAKPAALNLDPTVLKSQPKLAATVSSLTAYVYPHIFLYDGRGADKPWLQEIPEPVAQIVWDNWAEIHPETAKKLGVVQNQILELRTQAGAIELAAFLSEHVVPGALAIPMGQGHTAYGRYARGRGANPFALLANGRSFAGVQVRPTARQRKLISPLFGADMMGRSIVEAISIEALAAGKIPKEEPLAPGPYEMHTVFEYPDHEWGMTLDVNACTGCSACVAACYAENNLSVVGREAVDRGRIMSWIRIERYVPERGQENSSPQLYVAPVFCQQCAQAPCEPVCPVFAAVHTPEGLNGQIYNRCVGTRYCENNCPYKVRRFNWFAPQWDAPLNLQLNPDVTVRGAGVMEKCTFCVQRIVAAEINAKVQGRKLRDGEFTTACAQACPTHAITFGDMKDPSSAMMKRRAANKERGYKMLEDINTKPHVVYLRDLFHERQEGRA